MSDHTYRVIEIVGGSSTTGSDDAVRNAITSAPRRRYSNLDWFQVE